MPYKRAKHVLFDVYKCPAETVPVLNTGPDCFGGLAEQGVILVQVIRRLALNDTQVPGKVIKRRFHRGRDSRIRPLGQAFCRYLGMIKYIG